MKRLIAFLLIVLLIAFGYFWWRSTTKAADTQTASLIPLLSEENTAGFAQATEPNNISFPRDLGPHDAYQTEWWYYTGNLETADGRPFGFQLTFFRRALTAQEASEQEASDWRTNQVYLAHFTISDIEGNAFYPTERFSRGAASLAGAQAEPYRVWLENWFVEATGPEQVHLFAQTSEVTLDLTLTQTLPPILHGDGGLSPKGPERGNASYYYSIIQQQADGTVVVGEATYEVTGLAWKDHEYSTSALTDEAVGWDWFSLQFDDGSALMFFQIRREDGRLEPASSGTYIYPDGTTQTLDREDWQMTVTDNWVSPHSGADYPAGWQITIPVLGLEIEGRPLMDDQELNVSTTYWEGAVAFSGTISDQAVEAQGYIELTGYAETMKGRL